LAKKDFVKIDNSQWPTAPLPKSGGYAQLIPPEVSYTSILSPQREVALLENMWTECRKLSDHDADILDALSALFLRRAKDPGDSVRASVNELLSMRGLKPIIG
jgi:hypothetical protein